MGLFDFTPKKRKKRPQTEEYIERLGLSANPDVDMALFLMKLQRAHDDAEIYGRSVYEKAYDPAHLLRPDPYPHGKTPPPGKKGWVYDPKDPFKKKRQI